MALKSMQQDINGVVTTYHRIDRVMVSYSGDGSLEVVLTHYVDETIRDRQKQGELCGSIYESNEYIPLGENQSFDRAVLYPRLKLETERYQNAEDI
ncbi:hypothetical protein SDC9_212328 [bioreactor metagenome]|uniref:Uncharacterized protein n=1 Tax=bioreactor metagenome TaxID=1076179 RepID=A0A645K029_9ZZZZ